MTIVPIAHNAEGRRQPGQRMAILIDGYNLLFAIGLPSGPAEHNLLAKARSGLVAFLASVLTPEERRQTVVVFDAAGSLRPATTPQTIRDIVVRYAAGNSDADAELEDLIRADTSPRKLTVVSSDHRVQRAAIRRRARAVDSETWFEEVRSRRPATEASSPASAETDRRAPLSPEELASWLREFADNAPASDGDAATAAANQPMHELLPPELDQQALGMTLEEWERQGRPDRRR